MKGYKTFLFNTAATILPILEATDLTDTIGTQGMQFYGLGIAIVNLVLRFFTTTPVFQKK